MSQRSLYSFGKNMNETERLYLYASLYEKFSSKICKLCRNKVVLNAVPFFERTAVCLDCADKSFLLKCDWWDSMFCKVLQIRREEFSMISNSIPQNMNNSDIYPLWGHTVYVKNLENTCQILIDYRKKLENKYGEVVSDSRRYEIFKKFIKDNFQHKKREIFRRYRLWIYKRGYFVFKKGYFSCRIG